MKKNNRSILTAREEEIMNIFWSRGALFVKDILDILDPPKPHFNTISTIVRGLEDKGFVSHQVMGSTHKYFAKISEAEFGKITLKNVIGKYFGNSTFSAVSALIKEEKIPQREIESLLDMINNNTINH
jgi:BlaI family transcriptional regulator, penicillinase repressor